MRYTDKKKYINQKISGATEVFNLKNCGWLWSSNLLSEMLCNLLEPVPGIPQTAYLSYQAIKIFWCRCFGSWEGVVWETTGTKVINLSSWCLYSKILALLFCLMMKDLLQSSLIDCWCWLQHSSRFSEFLFNMSDTDDIWNPMSDSRNHVRLLPDDSNSIFKTATFHNPQIVL